MKRIRNAKIRDDWDEATDEIAQTNSQGGEKQSMSTDFLQPFAELEHEHQSTLIGYARVSRENLSQPCRSAVGCRNGSFALRDYPLINSFKISRDETRDTRPYPERAKDFVHFSVDFGPAGSIESTGNGLQTVSKDVLFAFGRQVSTIVRYGSLYCLPNPHRDRPCHQFGESSLIHELRRSDRRQPRSQSERHHEAITEPNDTEECQSTAYHLIRSHIPNHCMRDQATRWCHFCPATRCTCRSQRCRGCCDHGASLHSVVVINKQSADLRRVDRGRSVERIVQ